MMVMTTAVQQSAGKSNSSSSDEKECKIKAVQRREGKGEMASLSPSLSVGSFAEAVECGDAGVGLGEEELECLAVAGGRVGLGVAGACERGVDERGEAPEARAQCGSGAVHGRAHLGTVHAAHGVVDLRADLCVHMGEVQVR